MAIDFFVILLVFFSSLIAASSQLLLKTSASIKHKNILFEYFNFRVIASYGMLFFTTIINMVCMWYLPFKLVTILATSSYVFVIIFARIFFKEKINSHKIIGAGMIMAGMVVFNF